MSNQPVVDQKTIIHNIKNSLKAADKFIKNRRKTNTRLLVTGMSTSAASTLVAGVTSAAGPVLGSGIEGWRMACIAAAGLSLIATVSAGISQRLEISDRLNKASQCLDRLRSLDLSITTGNKTWDVIIQEYHEIASLFPEFTS